MPEITPLPFKMAETTAEDIFLPEKVVDSGFGQQDGKRYYKVKWVRYTWEAEDALPNLKELLDAFWCEHGGIPDQKSKEVIDEDSLKSSESEAKDNSKKEITYEVDGEKPGNTSVNSTDEQKELISVLYKTDAVTNSLSKVAELSTLEAVSALHNITSSSTTQSTYTYESGKETKYITLEKHTCDVCLRVFSSTQALRTHKRSAHKTEKQFQCETCLKMFSEKSTLRRHTYIHLEEKPFKCEHCDKGFSDKSTLRRHLVTHTGVKRFQCNCCDKRFTRNEHLRQHMFIHTAEKIYKCDVCFKNFRQRSTLKNHMLLHRADNAIKCELCGALFGKQVQLDKHLVWCNGSLSTFKCDECDKSFQDRSGLKRHMLLHSGERPFKCDYCDQSFNDRSILRRHIFKHTDKKPFQCAVCNKEFLRKATLQSHVSREHSDEVSRSMFGNLVHTYDLSDGLSLNESGLDQHVQFVIQPDETEMESVISQVEVSTNNLLHNNGVTVLAHTVCNIPESTLLTNINNKQVLQANQQIKIVNQHDLQPGENQLLQVQIIQMENGNQIVQSIQALPSDSTPIVVGTDSQSICITDTHGKLTMSDTQSMIQLTDNQDTTLDDNGSDDPTIDIQDQNRRGDNKTLNVDKTGTDTDTNINSTSSSLSHQVNIQEDNTCSSDDDFVIDRRLGTSVKSNEREEEL